MTDRSEIFDAHVHVWGDDRAAYPQVPGRERPPSHLGSADLLVQLMDAAGVDYALLVQTPWYGEDNRYLVDAMRRFPGRFAALGYLEDPLADDASDRLMRQTDGDGFHGVRLHLTIEAVNAGAQEGKADPLFRRARELGVPVQFLNRVPAHPTILGVARRFPDLTIVVDHLGHPEVAEAPGFASSAPFFALAEHPNVYVKVSNHDLHSRAPYPWPDLFDYQRRVIDAFGPRRLMWGSNWPMKHPELSYADRLDGVRHHLPAFLALSEEDRSWILARTALTIWRPHEPTT
jgi:predicted TIM-barrel fold metal-dependent hydrolase